jgi:DNA-binding MarR family transcriptional regulator
MATDAAEFRSAAANTAGGLSDRLWQSSLGQEIPFLLAKARALTSGEANRQLSEVDLKVRTYSVLSLACSGMNPSQRELCEFLDLDPSQIVALVDELQNRGAVKREADPKDRRSRLIVGTPAGRRLLRRAKGLIENATDHNLRPLDADEQETLRDLLTRVCSRSSDR